MEVFQHKFQKTNHVSIFVLSDIHEGHASHNEEALRMAVSMIETASKTRDCLVILNGDIIDCIEVSDKRFNPAEISEKYKLRDLKDLPRRQADKVLETLAPIQHLIKYSVIGNHEESYIREHHFDVYDYYSHFLGCQKLGFFGLIRFTVSCPGKSTQGVQRDFGITHGRGGSGGKTLGYPLNWTKDIFEKFELNVGVAGHRHKLIVHPALKLLVNQNLKLVKRTRWYAVAGGFLDSYTIGNSGYFEGAMGETSDVGFLEYKIDRAHEGWKSELVGIRLK
jgi:hypothetical protein